MNPEGLIELPEASADQTRGTFALWFVLLTFLVILVGTTVVDLAFPLDAPKLEGKEAQDYDKRVAEATWSDGSLARLIEYKYRIQSRVRSEAAMPYATFLHRYLREGGKKQMVGSDDWTFLTERIQVPDIHHDVAARRIAAEMAALSRRMFSMGAELTVIPLPRKAVIMQKHMPFGMDPRPDYDRALLDAFQLYGVPVIDLWPLWSGPRSEEVYRKTDTHWSTQGVHMSAEEIARQLDMLVPEEDRLGQLKSDKKGGYPGSFYQMANAKPHPRGSDIYEKEILYLAEDRNYLEVGDNTAETVLCGTSFSQDNVFARFLTHFMGTRVQSFGIRGKPPEAALLKMVQARKGLAFPRRILFEAPNHLLMRAAVRKNSWTLKGRSKKIFAELPPPATKVLELPKMNFGGSVKLGKELGLKKGRVLAAVEKGWIARTGRGELDMGVTVQVLAGELDLVAVSGKYRCGLPCTPGWGNYVIPLMNIHPTNDVMSVNIRQLKQNKDSRFVLGNITLLSCVDESTKVEGKIANLESSAQTLSQKIEFPTHPALVSRATLILHTQHRRGSVQDLRVLVSDRTGERTHEYSFDKLNHGGWIVIDPCELIGEPLGSVTVQAVTDAKKTPESWIIDAGLYRVR